MAFGFLGDIVEEIGEVILPRGTRGATLGAIAGAATGTSPATGAALGAGLSRAIATGSRGQEAVSSPTASQTPGFAPESSLSSTMPGVYRPQAPMTAGFAGFPRIPNTVKDIATGIGMGEVMDIIPDINISKFFGAVDPCSTPKKKLVTMSRRADGSVCPTMSRKQQREVRRMLEFLPIEEVAYQAGVDVGTLGRLAAETKAPRRRGISGSQLANAKRVNNQILNMANKLGYNCTPKTKAQLGCK